MFRNKIWFQSNKLTCYVHPVRQVPKIRLSCSGYMCCCYQISLKEANRLSNEARTNNVSRLWLLINKHWFNIPVRWLLTWGDYTETGCGGLQLAGILPSSSPQTQLASILQSHRTQHLLKTKQNGWIHIQSIQATLCPFSQRSYFLGLLCKLNVKVATWPPQVDWGPLHYPCVISKGVQDPTDNRSTHLIPWKNQIPVKPMYLIQILITQSPCTL